MNKKILIPIIVILIIATGIGIFFIFQKLAFPEQSLGRCGDGICGPVERAYPEACPRDCEDILQPSQILPESNVTQRSLGTPDTFVLIHFEVGVFKKWEWYQKIAPDASVTNLKYQEALWPTTIKLIELADRYKVKLTLAFNPQWAEYILKDEEKINIIKKWQSNGHEIAFHHHGYEHPDWNGYSNRNDSNITNDSRYRGTAEDGYKYVKQLAYPKEVITGTITDIHTDLVEGLSILTKGGTKFDQGIDDAVSKPKEISLGNRTIISLSHGFLESYFNDEQKTLDLVETFKKKYKEVKEMDDNYIFGIVTHEHDFYRFPAALEKWFEFLKEQDPEMTHNKTISQIIEEK